MMEDRSSSEPEDVGKEDMFVDAPDQYLEDSVVIVGDQADGDDVRRLSHELATARSQLHDALAGKDLVFREFGEFKVCCWNVSDRFSSFFLKVLFFAVIAAVLWLIWCRKSFDCFTPSCNR